MSRDKRTWQGSAKSESYLREFLEHCQRANLPGKQRIIELLQKTLAGQAYSEERDPAQPAATNVPTTDASNDDAKPARVEPPTEPAAPPTIVTVSNATKKTG